MKDKKILFITGIVLLFLMTVGMSYAYFSASVSGNADAKDMVVEAGTLRLTYTDSPQIIMQNIKPGTSITKVVTVENTGTLDTAYNLVWQELNNEIINDEMLIEATCRRLNSQTKEVNGTCEGLTSTPIKKIKVKENVSIEANITHEYTITITFKETNSAQNYNQGKVFNGVLGIKEYKTPEVVNCTFDGELTPGTEYVNGQYTYRYMQEGNVYINEFSQRSLYWNDITEDGWGVARTDITSNDVLTDKICTFINDKPVVSMSYLFENTLADSVDLDSLNTSNVTNMSRMFAFSDITTLDLSNFDTSKVTDMSGMFSYSEATAVDLSNFDTSKVTNMKNMFEYSNATILDLSNFDTSKVTNMSCMFCGSTLANIDLSNFNTSNVTDMSSMFTAIKATTLDLSNFDTSKVTSMGYMFNGSKVTTLDLSSFDTRNVTVMSGMFRNSEATAVDLSSFDTRNVTDMSGMFGYSNNLKAIYASGKYDTSKVTSSSNMFSGCTLLVGGQGTTYDSTKVDKTYARIDGGTSSPGYFTSK